MPAYYTSIATNFEVAEAQAIAEAIIWNRRYFQPPNQDLINRTGTFAQGAELLGALNVAVNPIVVWNLIPMNVNLYD